MQSTARQDTPAASEYELFVLFFYQTSVTLVPLRGYTGLKNMPYEKFHYEFIAVPGSVMPLPDGNEMKFFIKRTKTVS